VILIDLSVNPDIMGLQEGESRSPLQAGISIITVQVTTCVSDARYSDSLTQRHALLLAGHRQGHHVGGRGQGYYRKLGMDSITDKDENDCVTEVIRKEDNPCSQP